MNDVEPGRSKEWLGFLLTPKNSFININSTIKFMGRAMNSHNLFKRGLVISSPTMIDGENVTLGGLDQQELRTSLLFWDRLEWPRSKYAFTRAGPDEDFLIQEGIMSRQVYDYDGTARDVLLRPVLAAFAWLEAEEPGRWSLCDGTNSIQIKGGSLEQSNNFQLELYRAIPVPDCEVPLPEILEFKLKRKDELELLRIEIDRFVGEIDRADDKVDALMRWRKHVDRACADVLKISAEWQWPVRLSNLKCTFQWKPVESLYRILAAQKWGMELADAALAELVRVAGSEIKISCDGVSWRGLRPRPSPFRYVARYHTELF